MRWFALLVGVYTANAGAAGVSKDPRPLTATEIATFLPLVCGHAKFKGREPSGNSTDADVYRCAEVIGHPDHHPSVVPDTISLTSILYGEFVSPGRVQAYVSYYGLEPHSRNYGGGIVFDRTAAGWRLTEWNTGFSFTGCLLATAAPYWEMLCLDESVFTGDKHEGLDTTSLREMLFEPVGPMFTSGPRTHLTLSHDIWAERNTNSNNPDLAGCDNLAPGNSLYHLEKLRRSTHPGIIAEVDVSWVPDLKAYDPCNDQTPLRHGTISLRLRGHEIETILPPGLPVPPPFQP